MGSTPDVIPGKFMYFAMDNINFQKDIPDGKATLHATVLILYEDNKGCCSIKGESNIK